MNEYDFYTVVFGVSRALGCMSNGIWARVFGLPIERPNSIDLVKISQLGQAKNEWWSSNLSIYNHSNKSSYYLSIIFSHSYTWKIHYRFYYGSSLLQVSDDFFSSFPLSTLFLLSTCLSLCFSCFPSCCFPFDSILAYPQGNLQL